MTRVSVSASHDPDAAREPPALAASDAAWAGRAL